MIEHYAWSSLTKKRICGLVGCINAVEDSRDPSRQNKAVQGDNALVEASQRKKRHRILDDGSKPTLAA